MHDIEDGLRVGLIREEQLEEVELWLAPVLFGALGDRTSVPTALLALAALLLLTLPLAWQVQKGVAHRGAT